MSNNLFNLFDDQLRSQRNLVASQPHNLDSISSVVEEQEFLLRKIKDAEVVKPKVDYSDFKNFVFFNSALDYFNIAGETILNKFPYDSSVGVIQGFIDELDDYQKYVVDTWPRHSGHLEFKPENNHYVTIDDVGISSDGSKTNMLSPGVGSLTFEAWCIPPPVLIGANDVMILLQKTSGGNGYSVYFSGSRIYFSMKSGSAVSEVSAETTPGVISYYSGIYDAVDSQVMTILTGSATSFPVPVQSADISSIGSVITSGEKLLLATGSLAGKLTMPFNGSLDNIRLWNIARNISDIKSNYNIKVGAQSNLIGLWRFNEVGSTVLPSDSKTVFDFSGHKLNGVIQNYSSSVRIPGSLIPYEDPDLILSMKASEVKSLISAQHELAMTYDRNNDNIITKMLPAQFFRLEDDKNTSVLQDFIYVMARQFDQIKVRIDQFVNVTRLNYGQFNQTPDALLNEVGSFFGWEFTGNFIDADAVQYILGKNVLQDVERNKNTDISLINIKNEFWKRTLINLMHLYKTKGTRESVESLFRIYGVNKNFVKLKEYGYKQNSKINTFRINAEKSVAAISFGGGSTAATGYIRSPEFISRARTIETRIRFPSAESIDMPATIMTGTVWTLNSPVVPEHMVYQLNYTRDSDNPTTGALFVTGSHGTLAINNISIFNDKWYNVSFVRDDSNHLTLGIKSIENKEIITNLSSSVTFASPIGPESYVFWLGAYGSLPSQQWVQETRVWNDALNSNELNDHALNFQSIGIENILNEPNVSLYWRLNDDIPSSADGNFVAKIYDMSRKNTHGSGFGFTPLSNPYKKFLNEYNYIASPEHSWNEEKIRTFPGLTLTPNNDKFNDNKLLSLEFNMIDALNEDITQIFATIDGFNNIIGLPANRYREEYNDLETLRENYFKRLDGRLNFRVFFDMLEFFDRSFINMIRKLIPARALFIGDGFVVESHMLERPKLQWNYRRQDIEFNKMQIEGVIKVLERQ